MEIRGTETSMPVGPQISPRSTTTKSTITGCVSSNTSPRSLIMPASVGLRPMTNDSRPLETANLMSNSPPAAHASLPKRTMRETRESRRMTGTGSRSPRKTPTSGMKPRTNISTAIRTARSTSSHSRRTKARMAKQVLHAALSAKNVRTILNICWPPFQRMGTSSHMSTYIRNINACARKPELASRILFRQLAARPPSWSDMLLRWSMSCCCVSGSSRLNIWVMILCSSRAPCL
mmetsp:Transcript_21691/g.61480  ORF Transcript_21691/g.61480 Transcript_21691/m.61480 type:complete len:234 (-) Transcript_21691:514-1215(-)